MNRDALTAPLLDQCSGADHHRYSFELPARVEFVARARRLARERLHFWGIGGDVHDTAMLVVSELVTNAVVHTDGHLVACELLNGAERLRITVQDQGSSPDGPHVCHTLEEERGRGLLLVEAVSSAWGRTTRSTAPAVSSGRNCRTPARPGRAAFRTPALPTSPAFRTIRRGHAEKPGDAPLLPELLPERPPRHRPHRDPVDPARPSAHALGPSGL